MFMSLWNVLADLNSIQLIETLTREDWADVLPTPIGLRLRLHKAAGTIQLRHTIERENGIIQAKRTSLERLKAKNNALSEYSILFLFTHVFYCTSPTYFPVLVLKQHNYDEFYVFDALQSKHL